MNGGQRFAVLIVCCFTVMVCYPDFDAAGWAFIGTILAMWTGVIVILSIVSNLFGLYKWESLNKLIFFVLTCAIMYSLLWYFPQTDKVTPINKIKYGEIPTKADLDRGLKRFTFNFDFVRRNARRKENFINQDMNSKEVKKELKKKAAKTAEELIEKMDLEDEE